MELWPRFLISMAFGAFTGEFWARRASSALRRYSDFGTLVEVADRLDVGVESGVAGLKVGSRDDPRDDGGVAISSAVMIVVWLLPIMPNSKSADRA